MIPLLRAAICRVAASGMLKARMQIGIHRDTETGCVLIAVMRAGPPETIESDSHSNEVLEHKREPL